MNRKSKIIVSVVGITIVLLALLGITYAYYLTRIEGNTNTNSITVSTADLKLVYGDGESELVTMTNIMPGTVIEKDFTVTNSGKSKVEGYLVVLENVNNTLNRKEDVVYTLNCKLSDATSCGSVTETIYPSISTSVIFTNDIDVDVTHYYTLTVTYKNLEDVDQSEDMGKMFDGRVNIMDGNTNPYTTGVTATDNASLVYNIINNSMTNANGTTYSPVPLTPPVKEASNENEKTLSITSDNLGTSYYFRGSVEDNYVLFNNMCFRIVRIEGDGSVKLIFAGDVSEGATNCNEVSNNSGVLKDTNSNFKIANEVIFYPFTQEDSIYVILEDWFNSKFTTDLLKEKTKLDKWCVGDSELIYDDNYDIIENLDDYLEENDYTFHYPASNRMYNLKTTSLMCENEEYVESKFGVVNIDEVMLAGGKADSNNSYYLIENMVGIEYDGDVFFSTATQEGYDGYDPWMFILWLDGTISNGCSNCGETFITRPSITLIPGTTISGGTGAKANPYIIN